MFHSQGTLKYSEAFSLSLSLGKEKEYLPIRMFVAHMTRMLSKFAFSRERCVMQLLKVLYIPALNSLGQMKRFLYCKPYCLIPACTFIRLPLEK